MAKLSQIQLGSTTYDIGAAWGNITGKPSTFTPSSHTHSYLPLSGGTLTGTVNSSGNMNLYGSNAYFSLGTSASSSKCYFQTYNATTAGADDANLKAGFGFGWSNSLVIDKSGNVTIPGDLTVSGGDIVGKASSAKVADAVAWNNITGKPSSFPPAAHNHDSAYLKLSGGTLTGLLNAHGGISLNSSTVQASGAPEYILGIKAFAEGGNVIWQSRANVSVGYADSAGTCTSLSTNAGSTTKAIYFSGGKPAQCNNTLNHNISGNANTASLWALTGTANTTTGHSDWDGGVGNTNKYTVYDQEWACSSIGADTGDLRVFLRPGEYSSGGTEVCFAIDGDYYVMGNKVLHAGNYSSYASPASYWSWSGQSGQPTWVWGGNDFGQYKVWNPSNFNVNSAKSSTSSSYLSINNSANLSDCLQYIQVSAQNSGKDLPSNTWWHVIKMNHGQGDTYYKRLLAFDFWNDNIMTSGAAGDGKVRTWKQVWVQGNAVTGAVWNDYAECRESDCLEAGYVLAENGNDSLSKTTERLSSFAGVSSDTWGFSQGETEKAKTHIAVAGRVLVYPYQNRNNYKPGDCVCAAPGGTVDIMTREEVINWPDRIVGTVSCVPEYEEWGGGEIADRDPVKVNGRIWIKVR